MCYNVIRQLEGSCSLEPLKKLKKENLANELRLAELKEAHELHELELKAKQEKALLEIEAKKEATKREHALQWLIWVDIPLQIELVPLTLLEILD